MSLVKAAETIISEQISRITTLNTNIKPTNYSLAKIVAIDPPGRQAARLWYLLDYLQKAQSIIGFLEVVSDYSYRVGLRAALGYHESTGMAYTEAQVDIMISSDAQEYVKNFLIYRTPSTPASGAYLLINSTGNVMSANEGDLIETPKGVEFELTQSISGVTPVYIDTSSGVWVGGYAYQVPIRAVNNGVSGNKPVGIIINIKSSMAGVERGINITETTGGSEQESIASMLTRAAEAWQGRNLPTRGGYYTYLTNKSSVYDVLVVMPGDDFSYRQGTADIYVQGRTTGIAVDYKQYNNTAIYIRKQPVIGITSVVGALTYVEGTDFDFVKDVGAFANSYRGRDKIEFRAGHEPAMSENLTINYTYDALATTLQTDIDDPENREVVGDLLIKIAKRDRIHITARITYLPGYDIVTVASNIETQIGLYFSGDTAGSMARKLLGDDVYQSDIIAIIEGVEGVDYIETPLTAFYKQRENEFANPSSDSTITIPANEYAVLGNLIIVVADVGV